MRSFTGVLEWVGKGVGAEGVGEQAVILTAGGPRVGEVGLLEGRRTKFGMLGLFVDPMVDTNQPLRAC